VRVPATWVKFFFWIYLLFLVGIYATAANPADPDLWHRLAVGEYLCRHGQLPAGDVFSYLADYKEIADHEWGSALIFFSLYQVAGLNVFVVLKALSLALTLALLIRAGLWDRTPTPVWAAFYVIVLLALLPSFQSTVRCMVFTNLIFALWLYWFQKERHNRPVPIFFYALTMILWANLHGGYVIGLLWLLVVAVVEMIYRGPWQIWAKRFVICSLATLVNPFGWGLWESTWRALVITRSGFDEWAPVSWFSSPQLYPGYKLLFVGVLAALVFQIHRKSWRRIEQSRVILIAIFMALSLVSARHTSLFAAVAGALLPGLYPKADWMPPHRIHPLRRLAAIAVSSAALLVPFFAALIVMPGDGLQIKYDSSSCPVQAVAFLQKRDIQGNLLVSFNYGSYALWQLRGKMRVSMDGRYDLVYRPETYRGVADFFSGKGDWQSLLTSPAPSAILVAETDAVYHKLQAEPSWQEAYHDGTDAVFLPK
jgi:hypothetical protein